jgi:RNA polymerase sigma-32 factor
MSCTTRASYAVLVHQIPKLSRERERELVERWRKRADAAARDELIRSQLRHVVAVARSYRRDGGARLDELIAEGNFGLLHALGKFDPDRGTRFVTYAVYWIRAYISQYLVRSKSLVTTGVQSKLLSRIRRERAKAATWNGASGDSQIASRLALSPEKLRSLVERLDLRDVPWDISTEDALSARFLEVHEAPSLNAEERVLSQEADQHLSAAVSGALSKLDARERYVVERRLMAHREEQLSLAEVGRAFRISRERIRQIEARAMRKLRAALSRPPYAFCAPLLDVVSAAR